VVVVPQRLDDRDPRPVPLDREQRLVVVDRHQQHPPRQQVQRHVALVLRDLRLRHVIEHVDRVEVAGGERVRLALRDIPRHDVLAGPALQLLRNAASRCARIAA
jgi:hypothetical protein